ncbi:hypothetical protein RHSIM_Rhsim07G0212500 [Rhododendron simsii]|uniref:Uncharacterized protein n=1 Tax=Rhododendron simsii TaxID=118357 RepID=A0A834LHU2_RHOSS|nr:hypothetical protein RHSIM_Rhsim07G0212500 [Rhododendron simsii]
MFLLMHNIPQKAFARFRAYRSLSETQAKRHFVLGATLFSRAEAEAKANNKDAAMALAKSAAEEADKAIAIDPKDAAAHILKALALDLQGFRTSALDSFDVALSPMAAKSLSNAERGDALFKRAKLKVDMSSQGERIDSAIADLVESVKLRTDNAKAYCFLAECYEKKGMVVEAKSAYEESTRVQPELMTSAAAIEALKRLSS